MNQGGQFRAYKYDDLGRLLYERIPEQIATIDDGTGTKWTTKYTYTDFNAVATRTDARGVITTYTYDAMNRPATINYDTSQVQAVATANNIPYVPVAATNYVTYTYETSPTSNNNGLLLSISMTGPLATYTENFSYDAYRRVYSRTWSRDELSYTIGYQYNIGSQLYQMTYPSGMVLNYSYDGSGRLSSIADFSRTYLSGITYNAAGQVTARNYGNGVTESFGYDSQRLQMTSQTATASGGPVGGLMSLTYSYQAAAGQNGAGTTAGNAGQLMTISGQIGGLTESASYTYDLQGRLATSSQTTNGASAQRRFAYDRFGNRTGVWDATSGGNQIQSIILQQSGGAPTNRITSVTSGGQTLNYTYDAAGNLINDGVHTYNYDAENRLKAVDEGTANPIYYAYDYANRRIKKLAAGVSTNYVWEGSQVIAEHNGTTGAVIFNYVNVGGKLIARMGSGIIKWYLSDRLSSRVVLDDAGAILGRQGHLPYGEEVGVSGEQEKHRFTSYDRETEIGLDYAINRWSSPAVGRFTSADPYRASGYKVDPQSWNRYSYTRNDPANRIDPFGLEDYAFNETMNVNGGGGGGITADSARWTPGLMGDPSIGPLLGGGEGHGGGGDRSQGGGGQSPIPPPPVANADKGQTKDFNNAFNEAVSRLDNNACAALFGGKDKALQTLRGASYGYSDSLGRPTQSEDGSVDVKGAATIGNSVFINIYGPFRNTNILVVTPGGVVSKTVDGGTKLRGKQFGALLLLHELGHLTKVFLPDADDKDLNKAQTQKVLDACFPKKK